MNIMTCIPGKIVSYDGLTATVKPSISMRLANGEELPPPNIKNVPAMWTTGGQGRGLITLPLAKGDDVLIFFSQRSTEEWKRGSNAAPSDPRRYDINDAFFTPVLRPTKSKADTTNLSIEYGGGSIKISPQGDIKIIGNVEVTGSLSTTADITAGPTSVSLLKHQHTGVTTGFGTSGPPAPSEPAP